MSSSVTPDPADQTPAAGERTPAWISSAADGPLSQTEEREWLSRVQSALLDSTSEGIYGLDQLGRCIFINRAAQAILGYRAEELLGRNMHAIVHSRRADGSPYPESECPVTLTLATGRAVTRDDEVLWRRDGSSLPAEYSSNPITDGRAVAGVVVIFRHVSERRRAEARTQFLLRAGRTLVESLDYEATLQRIAELAVPEIADWAAVHILDGDDRLRLVALIHRDQRRLAMVQQLRHSIPLDPGEPSGPAKVLRTGEPELLERIPPELFAAAPRLNEETRRMVTELGLGSAITVPLRARGGTLGTMTLAYAESGRHYSQADVPFIEDLADRAGLSVDNARLFRDLHEALRVRDDFLAAVSHDLRTPLTIIRGLTQLALRRAARIAGAGQITEALTRVDGATDRMAVMIDGLLDLSRLGTGRPLDLNLDRVDLAALVRQLVDDHQRAHPRHRFRLEGATDPLAGSWDRVRLTRMLSNLLMNAIKYSPDGGEILVSLSAERDPAGGEWAQVDVHDHGIGIPAGDLPRLFERFHRGSNVPEHIPGVGLGLPSAKQIAEQHGGTISVQSKEGEGSRFSVRLPIAPSPQMDD
jgi:PAS domain S-box-containing protein